MKKSKSVLAVGILGVTACCIALAPTVAAADLKPSSLEELDSQRQAFKTEAIDLLKGLPDTVQVDTYRSAETATAEVSETISVPTNAASSGYVEYRSGDSSDTAGRTSVKWEMVRLTSGKCFGKVALNGKSIDKTKWTRRGCIDALAKSAIFDAIAGPYVASKPIIFAKADKDLVSLSSDSKQLFASVNLSDQAGDEFSYLDQREARRFSALATINANNSELSLYESVTYSSSGDDLYSQTFKSKRWWAKQR